MTIGVLLLGNENTNRRLKRVLALAQISRMITNCAICDLGKSQLFEVFFFFSFYNCSKEEQQKQNSDFFKQQRHGNWDARLLKGPYWLQGSEPTLSEGQLCVCRFSAVVKEANNARIQLFHLFRNVFMCLKLPLITRSTLEKFRSQSKKSCMVFIVNYYPNFTNVN